VSDLLALEDLLILLVAAFLPALLYLSWVRTTERGQREGWSVVLGRFAYGAFFATIVAGILEVILVAAGTSVSQAVPAPEFFFLNGNSTAGVFFLILVVAPFVEEGLKALGVTGARAAIRTVADGPVLGAGVGLGFGFFETFLYGLGAFATGGLVAGLTLIVLRSFSSLLLHGASTAYFGYGYASGQLGGSSSAGPHYLGAVAIHASFNAVVSASTFAMLAGLSTTVQDLAAYAGIAGGILIAFATIEHVRGLIVQSAYPGALATHPRFRPPAPRRVYAGPRPPVR
jgi:RsiW-degrading membrane proteinase PrsW (M82 family)